MSSNPISRVMHKPDSFIRQIRQPLSIGSCQIGDPPLLKTNQQSSSSNCINKLTHHRINTCIAYTQVFVCSPRESNSFIKELNDRMINWLQTRPTESQRKLGLEFETKISNSLRTRLILFLRKADESTLRQMFGTTFI